MYFSFKTTIHIHMIGELFNMYMDLLSCNIREKKITVIQYVVQGGYPGKSPTCIGQVT
jgi:hypothetical protein